MIEQLLEQSGAIGGFLWKPWTFFVLMAAGILFTIWSKFTQYRSITHGFQVVRGKFDDPSDPGAINHFQALSAALSATVGLGNIGGVALAIAAGGPGALFWMWIIGFFGMALKTAEITLSMMYRNTDDPENPHGGAMWVIEKALGTKGGIWKPIARIIGIFFCITLLISSITGGNMFQSWSVADLTKTYWSVPPMVTGIILAVIVGMVIIGGIKRIGSVAGKLVPVMCVLYLFSALVVIVMRIDGIPAMFADVFRGAFQPTEAGGAFLGGSIGYAFSVGLRRALFSNEAGQGSAPIAHAAAKTDEPAREGIVGGIGPFIDTICICTLTACVILLTGTWNRDPLLKFASAEPVITPVVQFDESAVMNADEELKVKNTVFIQLDLSALPETDSPKPLDHLSGKIAKNKDGNLVVKWNTYNTFTMPEFTSLDLMMKDKAGGPDHHVGTIATMPPSKPAMDDSGTDKDTLDDVPLWGLLTSPETIERTKKNDYLWKTLEDDPEVFIVVHSDMNEKTNQFAKKKTFDRNTIEGKAKISDDHEVTIEWGTVVSKIEPQLVEGTGMYRKYEGASLTAHAFDRQVPGLGKFLIPVAAWLFAISTMISWSYYGEQGMIYMLGQRSVLPYKFAYLLLVIVAAGWISDASVMEPLMDLGTGAMLWSNIPIVIGCGFLAMRCLKDYDRRLFAGEFHAHAAPPFTDLIDSDDAE